jgi:hypothetical protein
MTSAGSKMLLKEERRRARGRNVCITYRQAVESEEGTGNVRFCLSCDVEVEVAN